MEPRCCCNTAAAVLYATQVFAKYPRRHQVWHCRDDEDPEGLDEIYRGRPEDLLLSAGQGWTEVGLRPEQTEHPRFADQYHHEILKGKSGPGLPTKQVVSCFQYALEEHHQGVYGQEVRGTR